MCGTGRQNARLDRHAINHDYSRRDNCVILCPKCHGHAKQVCRGIKHTLYIKEYTAGSIKTNKYECFEDNTCLILGSTECCLRKETPRKHKPKLFPKKQYYMLLAQELPSKNNYLLKRTAPTKSLKEDYEHVYIKEATEPIIKQGAKR